MKRIQNVYTLCVLLMLLLPSFDAAHAADEEGFPWEEVVVSSETLSQREDFPRNPTSAEQVCMLKEESLEQSLYRLKNINLFFSPGAVESGRIVFEGEENRLPLSEELEKYSIEVIMSNRRVLKLYAELGKLSKVSAAKWVNQYLTEVMVEYRSAYEKKEKENRAKCLEKVDAGRDNSITGVSFVSNTPHPNEVTLSGLRYAVLSLIWLAGALELEDTHTSIVDVAREGVLQRNRLYDDTVHHMTYKESVLKYLSLYNRTIIGNALIRTSKSLSSRLDLERIPSLLQEKRFSQTSYDATCTIYDKMRPDFSRGEIIIKYYTGITDGFFNSLMGMSYDSNQ